MGFEIEKKRVGSQQSSTGKDEWNIIGFINGSGTTTEMKTYSFVDNGISSGKFQYRLKQIDFDGTSEYSNIIETEIFIASDFILEQNYPNPFNPGTTIRYSIPNVTLSSSSRSESRDEGSRVQLKIYDILGNEVASLVNENKPAGNYEVIFNSGNLSSGVYFYKLSFGQLEVVKKMILIR
jgi:hypothetical protein